MSQQQNELLEERDLEEHEAGPERTEIREPRRPSSSGLPGDEQQRPDDEEEHQHRRDAEQREESAQPVAEQHRAPEGDRELIAETRRVEEEWPIVGRRT